MRNRHGDRYSLEQISESTYTITGDLKYWRFGGKEDQPAVDPNDLGFVDPSGGPFIQVGDKIAGRTIERIYVVSNVVGEEQIFFEVSPAA